MEKGNACTLEIRKDAELGKRVIEMERTIGKYENWKITLSYKK